MMVVYSCYVDYSGTRRETAFNSDPEVIRAMP